MYVASVARSRGADDQIARLIELSPRPHCRKSTALEITLPPATSTARLAPSSSTSPVLCVSDCLSICLLQSTSGRDVILAPVPVPVPVSVTEKPNEMLLLVLLLLLRNASD